MFPTTIDGLDQAQTALSARYDLVREVGRGGMAVVLLARDRKHDRDVAIKILRPELASLLGVERFLHEIQIESRLQHPHILPLHDSGVAGGLPYYVMPFVEGQSLRHRLTRERQLPVEEAIGIAQDVAEALEYAHGNGVVHRDVKPENILLSRDHALVADFGIARAVSAAGTTQLSSSGIVLGTPAYMSPEQADQDAVDGRSDLYSLACVVYEMLAGEPPFTGATAQAIVARQLGEKPRSLRVIRPAVPEHVERAVERALAKVPADRFSSTRAFVQALAAPAPRLRRRTRRRLWVMGAVVVGVALTLVARRIWGTRLDPSRYVLATMPNPAGEIDSLLQEVWEHEFESALKRTPEITVQDSYSVSDRLIRAGGAEGLSDWLGIAKDLGAGRAVVLRTVRLADSVEIIAEIYDVTRRSSLAQQSTRVGVEATGAGRQMARLVERLFRLPAGAITVAGTEVAEAARAFASARKAVEFWDLTRAAERFQEAMSLDPEYADAYLWLAKARAWADQPSETWVGAARYAVQHAAALSDEGSRRAARALLSMAERQFPRACVEYGRMIAADSLSFEAWYGLGECRRRDWAVIRDPRSPSGWRFRSSHHSAMRAYRRALENVPSANFAIFEVALSRMPAFAEASNLRVGRPLSPDTGRFLAFPSLDADTVGFVPYRDADVLSAQPGVVPATLRQAIQRNRAGLRELVASWVQAFPDSSPAVRELARVLELGGELDRAASSGPNALAAAQRAEATARTQLDSVNARVQSVRLRLKLGRFAEAAALADSALAQWSQPEPEVALRLAGLATLVGRPRVSARLAVLGASLLLTMEPGTFQGATPTLLREWKHFEAYATVGKPLDSLALLADRLERTLATVRDPNGPAGWDCPIGASTFGLAFPELRRATESSLCRRRSPYLDMQAVLAAGDLEGVRSRFAATIRLRQPLLAPGDLPPHVVFLEAWAVLQSGDTAAAVRHLDFMLNALPALRLTVLDDLRQPGGLIRAMVLRAELAASRNDRDTARRWAQAVVELWSRADPEFQRDRARMSTLVRG